MRSFLAAFLRLIARDRSVPPPTIADVLLFAAGEKGALRFAVPSSSQAALDEWAESAGLCRAHAAVVSSPRGQGWNLVESSDDTADGGGDAAPIALVVYARTRALAEAVRDRELAGDPEGAGRLLDYPACCVKAYAEAATSSPSAWIGAAVERAGDEPARAFCNRLPLAWNAPTFVGEIYPCSFACDALTAYGRRVEALMRAEGLEALAARTLTESRRPIRFRPSSSGEPDLPGTASLPLVVDDPRIPDLLIPR